MRSRGGCGGDRAVHAKGFSSVSHFNDTNTAFELGGRSGQSASNIALLATGFDSAANARSVAPAANFTDANCDLSGSGIYRAP